MFKTAQPQQVKYFSFEDYYEYDDETDNRYELIDGELVMMTSEFIFNSDVSMKLLFNLAKFIPLHYLKYKEVMIEVSGRRAKVRIPDLLTHIPLVMEWEKELRNRLRQKIVALAGGREEI